jgi:tyrosyl-tRNA synthetase
MQVKKALARRIVTDFHSEQAAHEAEENWTKQFQKHETPQDVPTVQVKLADVAGAGASEGEQSVRLDKVLVKSGLADSASDGQRKIKQRAVQVDGEVWDRPNLNVKVPAELLIRVGRRISRVQIEP